MRGMNIKALAIAGAFSFSFALAGCVPQAVKEYKVGTASSAVVMKIAELHEAGCKGQSAAARQRLIKLYHTFVDRSYPAGGVCKDPLGVLKFAMKGTD